MMPLRLSLVACLAVLVGCAGQTYRIDAGPMFARARGEIALASSNAGGTQFTPNVNTGNTANNSIDGNMGLGDTVPSPYLRGETVIDEHRFKLHGFLLDEDGTGTLGADYGNITAGTVVQTSLEFWTISGNYSYEVLKTNNLRIGLGAQVGFYSLDVAARPAAGFGREEVETVAIVPMPYGEIEWVMGDLTLGANGGVMAADLGDADGRYWDFEVYGNYQFNEDFGIRGGYRHLLLDGYGRASSRDFDADIDVQGLFVSAGVRF